MNILQLLPCSATNDNLVRNFVPGCCYPHQKHTPGIVVPCPAPKISIIFITLVYRIIHNHRIVQLLRFLEKVKNVAFLMWQKLKNYRHF